MAEPIDTEIHRHMSNNEMNQQDLASDTEKAQQMVELQRPLLSSQSSQPSKLTPNYLPQQQHVEDDVTIDLKEIIQNCSNDFLLSDCCIYMVPITLRHLKEVAYTPKVVSIGPFHYGNERLQDMERYKKILFKRFTERAMSSLDDLVCCVKHLEQRLRGSYAKTIKLTEQQLVKMTLMDASFIILLFIMRHERDEWSQPWLLASIQQDLMLLENQLPFFVIEELFNKAFPHERRPSSLPSFLRLTYNYFEYHNRQNLEPNPDVKIKHFTDLLRLFYLQGNIMSQRQPFTMDQFESPILSYNANALREAGIKLKASKSKYLLDLKFSGHVLEIPQIYVDDDTEILFRNMIALEQCHYPGATYISDYALVLDCLIDTNKDVDLLIQKKIVANFILGDSNKVASLFNGLPEHVVYGTFNSEYFNICGRLNDYCQDPWHKLKATLWRDYCCTPWQIVASIAAIVLLLLTIVQTIFSILQVVK